MTMGLKQIVNCGLLIGLSAILALVTIPSPTGTVAFDSLPGYIGAGLISAEVGGIIGFVGHLLTALYRGFPLGVVSHLLIALFMAITMIVYGYYYKKDQLFLAIVLAVFINSVLSLIPFAFIVNLGFALSMILPLTSASLINVMNGTIVIRSIKSVVLSRED